MKYLETINEWYKFPKDFDIFKPVPKTYTDLVFDDLMYIIMVEKGISEKDFKNIDNLKSYLEKYFDNNQEILLEIDGFYSDEKRSKYCAEYLFHKYFQNSKTILF